MPGKISILILTEDTGSDAHGVLCAVVEKLLFAAASPLNRSQIEFERAEERARLAMGFNLYCSANPKDYGRQLDLAGVIATKLMRAGMEAFVFVHIDGDRPWSGRYRDSEVLCDNHAMFARNVLRRVHLILEKAGRAEQIERIVAVLPFWSIEAWLYQNSREVNRLCALHAPRHDRDRAQFKAWEDDPSQLDEMVQPKLKVPTFKDKYNLELATTLSAKKLISVGLSFASTLERLQACRPLTVALAGIQFQSSPP